MPERYLAVVAGQDVQAQQGDRIHQHQRELEGAVAAGHEGQGAGHDEQCGDEEPAGVGQDQPGRESGLRIRLAGPQADPLEWSAAHGSSHTLVTWTLPNRPEGLATSTPMISTSATDSLSSLPIT